MAVKPILFSTPMVQAILDERKTQTRRIVKNLPSNHRRYRYDGEDEIGLHFIERMGSDGRPTERYLDIGFPEHKKGDVLWVRETFWLDSFTGDFEYKADGKSYISSKGFWKPSIHMPKEAARIFLEVIDVRCERLQDISEVDAIAEGVERISVTPFVHRFKNYVDDEELEFAESSFRTLWESINGVKSWGENPFVWVYEFKQVDKPSNF